jgi:hypothetical protein
MSGDNTDNGAAENTDPAEGAEDGADAGDITPPAANTWWQFDSKDAAEEWANNLVTKRLSRERKTKIEPLQQSHATLEAEVQRLKPFEEAAMTDAERREARDKETQSELEALRAFKAATERNHLVTSIAEEAGLDPKFLKFVNTDGDEESVRSQITDLLNALSESGSNTGKRTPKSKAPAPKDGDENGGGTTASGGGGGNGGDESDEALIASILEETAQIRKNGGFSVR